MPKNKPNTVLMMHGMLESDEVVNLPMVQLDLAEQFGIFATRYVPNTPAYDNEDALMLFKIITESILTTVNYTTTNFEETANMASLYFNGSEYGDVYEVCYYAQDFIITYRYDIMEKTKNIRSANDILLPFYWNEGFTMGNLSNIYLSCYLVDESFIEADYSDEDLNNDEIAS